MIIKWKRYNVNNKEFIFDINFTYCLNQNKTAFYCCFKLSICFFNSSFSRFKFSYSVFVTVIISSLVTVETSFFLAATIIEASNKPKQIIAITITTSNMPLISKSATPPISTQIKMLNNDKQMYVGIWSPKIALPSFEYIEMIMMKVTLKTEQ